MIGWWILWVGCGGTASMPAPTVAPFDGPVPYQGAVQPPAAPLPPEQAAAAVSAFLGGLLTQLQPCEANVVQRIQTWEPDQGPSPVSAADLQTHCGPYVAAYDQGIGAVGGQYRDAVRGLFGAARIAEDVEIAMYELRNPQQSPETLRSAFDHLRRALPESVPAMREVAALTSLKAEGADRSTQPQRTADLRARLRRTLESLHNDLTSLLSVYEKGAHVQGANPDLLRHRPLVNYGTWTHTIVEAAVATTAGTPLADPEDQRRLVEPTLAALGQARRVVETYGRLTAPFLDRTITADKLEPFHAELKEALASFEAEQQRALATLGE